jgi:hypothetical protein
VERTAGDAAFVEAEVLHGAIAGQGLAEMPRSEVAGGPDLVVRRRLKLPPDDN